ncbi:MAG: hypothetical protein ACI8VW_001199 [bacterium]|jgi:hypothetical protein
MLTTIVQLDRRSEITFQGIRLAKVQALNHDESVRRQFCVYQTTDGFIAERIDCPGTIDVRYWGEKCADVLAVYDFFGNEPLANYLYGCVKFNVPGLRVDS